MHVPTNLIEDIRTALAFSEQTSPDKLESYAREYARECTNVNNRLKQCLPHLRGGNIAEAVRLAEASPSVTETFNLLDFETRQDWIEVCDGLGLDVPPPLAVEIFQELNDAYLQMVPLEPLLKWHRLLALNGSPLRDRLTVLRSIAKADPMNLHWQTDQETFEKARIKELGKDITDALTKNDMPRLQELYRELTAPGWIVAPPVEYRQKICTAVLEKYANELMQHFSAFDYPHADAAYQSMQNVLSTNRMAMPAAIERNIRAAVQWLQETATEEQYLTQFQRETAELQEALDVYTPRETLENLYFALQNTASHLNRAIPKELESHYHSRIDYLHRVEKYRYGIVITIFGGSIILTAAIVIYALMERSFLEQVAQTLETLQQIETENKIDDIDRTLNAIKPKVANSSAVAPIVARLQGMLDKDNNRAKEFERYRSQADLLMDQKSDKAGLKAAKSSVDQADKLKRTPQEIMLFTDLRSKYDRLFRQNQLEDDQEFSGQLAKYRQEFNDLPQSANASYPPDKLVDQLKTLTANVRNLLSQYPDISVQQKREGDGLLDTIAKRQQSVQQTAAETEEFRSMLQRIGNLPSCKRILQDFSTKFPRHPAADDIKNVVKDFDSIQSAVESFQALCRSYTSSASNLKSQYEAAAAKIANIELVFPYSKDILILANMKPIDGNTFKATEELLKTIARRDLYPWIDHNDHWYYLTAKPLNDEGNRVINADKLEYVTTLGSTPKKYTLTSNNTERNKDNYELLQSKFAGDVLVQIDKLTTDPNKQIDAAEIIGRLLVKMNEAPGIDPILKIILFHSFISDYSKVDPVFADNFKRIVKLIEEGDVDLSMNWMDVEARETVSQRQKAKVMLNRIVELQAVVDKTKKETDDFRKKLSEMNPRFELIGLLIRQDRQWQCSTTRPLSSESGNLFVLQMYGGKIQPVQVGTVRDGKITLSSSINVLQCSPVFFVN